jgi:hypothetical protein
MIRWIAMELKSRTAADKEFVSRCAVDILECSRKCKISAKKVKSFIILLESILFDKKKFVDFKGYYFMEDDVRDLGIERHQAACMLAYLKKNRNFVPLIKKMDSTSSPIECRTFE